MKCPICGKVFSSKFCLKLHQRIHDRHGTQPEIIFATRAVNAKGFLKDVNHDTEKVDNTSTQKTEEPDGPAICKTCGKKFQDGESLALHMKFHGLFGMFKKVEPKKSQLLPVVIDITETEEQLPSDDEKSESPVKIRHFKKKYKKVEKTFECQVCNLKFASKRNHAKHELDHDRQNPVTVWSAEPTNFRFHCRICDYRTSYQAMFFLHMKNHKAEQKTEPQQSMTVGKEHVTHDRERLDREQVKIVKPPKPFKCDRCNRCFLSRKRLLVHICLFEKVVVVKKGLQVYNRKCLICGHITGTESSMLRHIKRLHKDNKISVTTINETVVTRPKENGDKLDSSEIIGSPVSETTGSSVVSEHMFELSESDASGELPVIVLPEESIENCEQEQLAINHKSELEDHAVDDNKYTEAIEKKDIKNSNRKSKILHCHLCGATYKSIRKLSHHFTQNHIKIYEIVVQYNKVKKKYYKVFKCLLCQSVFRSEKIHAKKHSKEHIQRLKNRLLKKMLQETMSKYEDDSSTATADSGSDSEETFKPGQSLNNKFDGNKKDINNVLSATALEDSQMSEKSSSRDNVSDCRASAEQQQSSDPVVGGLVVVATETELCEEKQKMYPCNICSLCFVKAELLEIHLLSHSNDENHKIYCRYCRISFTRSRDLFRHEITHRNEENPFICWNCDSKFRSRTLLDGHRENCASLQMDIDQQAGNDLEISVSQTVEIVKAEDNTKFLETSRNDHHENVKNVTPFNDEQNMAAQTSEVSSRKYMSQTAEDILPVEQSRYTAGTYGINSLANEDKTKADIVNRNGTISANIDGEFPCLRCDQFFPTKAKLTVHMQSHTWADDEISQFHCHFCDAPFKTSTGLFRHEVAHENENEPFLCRHCGSHFAYLAHRDYHKTKCCPQVNGNGPIGIENKTPHDIVSDDPANHRNQGLCKDNSISTLSISISSDASFLVKGTEASPRGSSKPKFDITDIKILEVRGSQYQYRPNIEGQLGTEKLASPLLADETTSGHVVRTQLQHQPQPGQDGSVNDQKKFDTIYENIAREEYGEYMKAKGLNHNWKSFCPQYGKETPHVIQNRSPNYTPVQQGQFMPHIENGRNFVKAISPQVIQDRSPNYTPVQQGQFMPHIENDRHFVKAISPQVIQNRSPNYTPLQQGQFMPHIENDRHFVKAISPQFIQADTNYHSYHLQNASEGLPQFIQQKSPNCTPCLPGQSTNYTAVNQVIKSPQSEQIEANINQAQLVTEKSASLLPPKVVQSPGISQKSMFTPVPTSFQAPIRVQSPGISQKSMFTPVPTSFQAPIRIQSPGISQKSMVSPVPTSFQAPIRIHSPGISQKSLVTPVPTSIQAPIRIQSPGISQKYMSTPVPNSLQAPIRMVSPGIGETPAFTSTSTSFSSNSQPVTSPNLLRPSISNVANQTSHLGTPFNVPQLQAGGQYNKAMYPPGTVLFYPFMPTGPNFIQHQMYEQYMHPMNPRLQFAQTQNIDLGHYQPYLTNPAVARQTLNRNVELSQSHQLYPKVIDASATVKAAVLHAQQLRRKDPNSAVSPSIPVANTFQRDNLVQTHSVGINATDQNNKYIENSETSTQQQDSGRQSKFGEEEKCDTPQYPPLQMESPIVNNVHLQRSRVNKRRISQNDSRYYKQNLSKRPSMALQSQYLNTAQISDNTVPLQEARDLKVCERQDQQLIGQKTRFPQTTVEQATGQLSKAQHGKGDELYQCEKCNRTFSRHLNFSRHQLMHAVNPPFECKTCGRVYTQQNYLEAHMRMHEGELPEECEFCGQRFLNKPLLGIHKLETHSYNSQ